MDSQVARRQSPATPIILANFQIEIRFDPSSGRISAIRNVAQNLDLIDGVLDTPPWRLELDQGRGWVEHFTSFSYTLEEPVESIERDHRVVTLRWETEFGITLISQVVVVADTPTIEFTI